MNDEHIEHAVERDEAIAAMLRQSCALPPAGFASRTVAAFAAAAARRQAQRVIALCTGLFLLSSATLWVLVLNIQNAAGSAWTGLKAAVALVEFIYTIWQRMPFTCGAVTVAMLSLLLLTGGLLGKVTDRRVLVK